MEETTLDRAAMGRLAKALVFICGPDHPTTVALQAAAEWFRARHQECAHAVSEIETRRPPGGIGHARRVIPPLGGARRLGFQRLGEFALRHEYGIRRSPAHRPPVLRGLFLWSAA